MLLFLAALAAGCNSDRRSVTVYASQDQVYAEPILGEFTRQTGIKVRPVFDSEAVKTVGLANRLLAERAHPQCDVFWNNEELRTRQLEARGLWRATNGWASMGLRSRRLAINTNRLQIAQAPRSVHDLTNALWRGKVALAYPLFGTTATHFLALRQYWGETNWLFWCHALAANRPFLVDGNSVVVQLLARGEAVVGLTDSDDIAAAQATGAPLAALPLTEELLLIPNTVAIMRDAPHPEMAQQLFDYLRTPPVMNQLLAAHALEQAAPSDATAKTLTVDWSRLLADLDRGTAMLERVFLK